MQITLSTSAGPHTWVGGMHPPQRWLRALKCSQAHKCSGPLPHGLCQGLQVASHQSEKALQVLLQPAGHSKSAADTSSIFQHGLRVGEHLRF